MSLKDSRQEAVDFVRRFRKGYLMTLSSSWKNVYAHSVIPSLRAMGCTCRRYPPVRRCPGMMD